MTILNQDTLIPAGVMLAILLAVVGATWRVATVLERIDRRLEKMEEALNDAWTITHQQAWEREFRDMNPHAGVPNALEIHRTLNGE